MDNQTLRILAIAPYEGMKTAIEHAAEGISGMSLDVYIGDLEEGAAIARRFKDENYDAIISRGGTAELIRKESSVPVVEIKITVYDVLRSIKLAENYFSRYAIAGFPSITEPAHILCDLLRYNIDILTVHNTQQVHQTLDRLRREDYHMVICDMVTHTIARQQQFDAFLITSGVESLHDALVEAMAQGAIYRRNRQERFFLQSLLKWQDGVTLVLRRDGSIYYSMPDMPSAGLLDLCRSKIGDVPRASQLRFYHNDKGALHMVSARTLQVEYLTLYVFNYQPTQIPLRTQRSGIRHLSQSECEHLFMNSFYSISGAMGELEPRIAPIAASRQPVMIMGEPGTGKEQIARLLYLRSPLCSKPFIIVDCTLMDDRGWDYLLDHHSSPLNNSGDTIYFQHLEDLPAARQQELLSVILETGLLKRERLIFSCNCLDGSPLPEIGSLFAMRLGCITLHLPTLRSRADEIPTLASLYINSLNIELGKQISGFDPNAAQLLEQYDWPNNYTQFKQVLHELATLATSAYIRSNAVAELLAKERALTRSTSAPAAGISIEGRTLDQIMFDAVAQAIVAHDGNQSSAARQLGISRTTLWRYVNRAPGNVHPPKGKTPD